MKTSRRTDLGVLFLANATIHMGRNYLLPTILTELSRDFSLSILQLGSIISLILAVEAISMPISGYISDRVGRSFSIPVSLLMYGLLLGLIGFFGGKSLSVFIAALTLIGVVVGFYHTAAISLILDFFDEKSRGKAQSVHSTGARIGAAIGSTLAGIIFLTKHPWSDVYLVLSIPVLVVSFLLFLKRVGQDIDRSRADLNRADPCGNLSLKPETSVALSALILLTAVRAIGAIQSEMISFILPTFLTQ